MVKLALAVAWLVASAAGNLWDLVGHSWSNAEPKGPESTSSPEEANQTRGSSSSPGLWHWFVSHGLQQEELENEPNRHGQSGEDSWGGPWIFRIGLRVLFQAAQNGFAYCGTLCASLGLAARWSYWLVTGIVIVFLLQLLVWSYTWVVYPTVVHSRALYRYCRGTAPWCEVSQLLGERPYRPNWRGPRASTPWSTQYIQTEVRGRGSNRHPYDLLVSDGTAVARLRHGTVRGRTNRFGFVCACDEVRSTSHRYLRNLLEAANCTVHLCASDPCGALDLPHFHIGVSAIEEVDLQDLAGRGPWARCANLTWLCRLFWCRCCRNSGQGCFRGLARCLCALLCCRQRRASRPAGSQRQDPRHDDSETESEAADDKGMCQADQVVIEREGKAIPLAKEPCRDVSRGTPVRLLKTDEVVSCHHGLKVEEDGTRSFQACDHHRALYQASMLGRACAVEGCTSPAYDLHQGIRLCKLHSARGDKPIKGRGRNEGPQPTPAPLGTAQAGTEANGMEPGTASLKSLLANVLQRMLSQEEYSEAFRTSLDEYPDLERKYGAETLQRHLSDEAGRYLSSELPEGDNEVTQTLRLIQSQMTPCSASQGDPILTLWHQQNEALKPERATSYAGPRNASFPEPAFEASTGNRSSALSVPSSAGKPIPVSWAGTDDGPTRSELAQSLLRKRKPGPSPATPVCTPQEVSREGFVAFRPFHSGAFTEPSSTYTDEATKAVQAIAKAVGAKDEAAAQERGKLSSVGKPEERAVFLVRGCDTLTVPSGEATVGKELFHTLRNMATQSRPLLRSLKFPINISNRFAFGVCSLTIGGWGQIAEHALTSGDFPQTSEEDYDMFTPPTDIKLEKKPRPPTSLSLWYRCALRQAWAIACVYGTEHYSSWEAAAGRLLKLGEEHAHAWPLGTVLATWDELWGRFGEEIRDLEKIKERNVRRSPFL